MSATAPAAARRTNSHTVATLSVLALLLTMLAGLGSAPARAATPTVSGNNLRTAWDANEPGLSPASVTSSDFGQLFSTPVDGQVYAEPIIAAGTLIAATEANGIYGLDPVTGAVRWHRNVGTPWTAATIGCGNIVPTVGITSTPMYDPATGSVFFFAKVNDGVDAEHPHWYVH